MPSRSDRGAVARASLLLVMLASLCMAAPATAAEERNAAPSEAEIKHALEQLKRDPNLGTERSTRRLKWVDEDEPVPQRDASWQAWLKHLFGWIGSAGRVVFWLVIAVLVALLAVFLARQARNLEAMQRREKDVAPTHVRELDIRPESLPDDVGAAAIALWEAGQHRAALALLYRGLLSRLVHVHRVAIKESSTESECLDLARPKLQDGQIQYVSRLLSVWQHAVYGGKDPQTDDVRTLCESFAVALAGGERPGPRHA